MRPSRFCFPSLLARWALGWALRWALRWALGWALLWAPLSALLGGCVTPTDLLVGQSCPCLAGWTCDNTRDVCVPVAADAAIDTRRVDARVADAGEDTRDVNSGDATRLDADGGDVGREPPAPVSTVCWEQPSGCDWNVPGMEFAERPMLGWADVTGADNPTFSPDGCVLYYTQSAALMRTSRSSASAPFISPRAVVNAPTQGDKATVAPDSLEMLVSAQGPGARAVMFRSRRTSLVADWPTFIVAEDLDVPEHNLFDPSLAPHGLRLYYAPQEDTAGQHLRVAERSSLEEEFREPVPMDETLFGLPGKSLAEPTISFDGRILVFVGSEAGVYDLYFASRPNWREPFGAAAPVPGAYVAANRISDVALSPDGCEIVVGTRAGEVAYLGYSSE